MAKDHFIPASLIARFSEETDGEVRRRKVWVARSNGSRAKVRAESVGYANGLYDVDQDMFPTRGHRAVDDIWGSYEPQLSRVLDRLIDGSVTATEWVDTLLPFVAAPFGRDRGYKERVAGRLVRHASTGSRIADFDITEFILDDTNIALNRVMEMERFAARALASMWEVIEVDGDLILPDLGYGFDLINEYPDVLMMLYPIGRRHLLTLTPCPQRRILKRSPDRWVPDISYGKSLVSSDDINRVLASTAQDFVVGSNAAIDGIKTENFAVFNWDGIDEVLEQWPFNIDTLSLSGLHRVVQAIVHDELKSLEGVLLTRHKSLADLEPNGLFLAPSGGIRADQVLALDKAGLVLTAHRSYTKSSR